MGSRTVVKGLSNLQKWLRRNQPELRETPVLFLSSDNSHLRQNSLPSAAQVVHHMLAQQLGLRTLSSSVVGAYPTRNDIKTQTELIQRSGAATVVAVGGGNSMDLASVLPSTVERTILVPVTYGGVLAASSSHSLLFDIEEEFLIPQASSTNQTTTVWPESDHMWIGNALHAKLAALSIIWASDRCSNVVSSSTNVALEDHDKVLDLLHQAGKVAAYGQEDTTNGGARSVSISLLCSLLPQLAPEMDALNFLACLSPSIVASSSSATGRNENEPLDGAPTFVVNQSVDQMLDTVRKNAALCNSLEASDALLRSVLENHSLAG